MKDLPYGEPLRVGWVKRRWACDEAACRRRTFSEVSEQLGPRRRLTLRLRRALATAVSGGPWSVAEV